MPDDMCLYIYTSGTTGPPKGCLLTHANYRAITDSVVKQSVLQGGDVSYLFLPLAHAFAILIQFGLFDLGVTVAYWSRDPKMIIADIAQAVADLLPSVPRMFEKDGHCRYERRRGPGATAPGGRGWGEGADHAVGGQGRAAGAAGRLRPGRETLFKNVRGLFGQKIRECA